MIEDLHHVQLAMPEGREDQAIGFYAGVLDLSVAEKPEALKGRGGVWFAHGAVQVHLGVERPFRPARKAHPGFQVGPLAQAVARIKAAGLMVRRDADLPGLSCVFVDDPFGNRIKLVEVLR